MRRYLILLFLCLSLVGCDSFRNDGGSSGIAKVTEVIAPDGTKTTTTIKADAKQPSNPSDATTISFELKPDDTVLIRTIVAGSQNTTKDLAEVNLLKLPMYFGVGLIALGGLAALVFNQYKWGIGLGATGAAMIIGTYLLAQYAPYFLFGIGIAAVWGCWLLYDYTKRKQAADEIVTANQIARETGVIDKEAYSKIAENIQSRSTAKIVKEIKDS